MSKSFVFYLCIAFGGLFLVMILLNAYLCCAIRGGNNRLFDSKLKADKSFEITTVNGKTVPRNGQHSKPEEFDPYTRSWHGSQYGSR